MAVSTAAAQPQAAPPSPDENALSAAVPSGSRAAGLAVAAGQAGLGFIVTSYGPYVAGLAAELGRPHRDLVWTTWAFGGGLLLAAALGTVALRVGAGRVLRIAAYTAGAGAVVMSLTPYLPLVAVGTGAAGLGSAAIVLLTPVLLHGEDTARRMTRAMGAAALGGLCAPLAFGVLESAGIPGRYALLLPVPLLIAITLRPSVPAPAKKPVEHRRPPLAPAARGGIRILLVVACEYCFVVWAVARIAETGVSIGTAAALGASYAVGMTVGRLGGQRIAGRPWAFHAAVGAVAVGTVITFAGTNALIVAAGVAIASMGVALLFPLTLANLVATPGLATDHAAALGSLAQGLAVLAAPAALGLLEGVVDLRLALLLPLPLLILLLIVRRTPPAA